MRFGFLGVTRRDGLSSRLLSAIAAQVDALHVLIEAGHRHLPAAAVPSHVTFEIVENVTVDEAKLTARMYGDDDHVCLLDASLRYPDSFVKTMLALFESVPLERKVLGLSGVIYSDFFDGRSRSCWRSDCAAALTRFRLVNELGLDALVCLGRDLPPPTLVRGAADFASVRYAGHAYDCKLPLLLVPRARGWVRHRPFHVRAPRLPMRLPVEVTREILRLGGWAKLDPRIAAEAQTW